MFPLRREGFQLYNSVFVLVSSKGVFCIFTTDERLRYRGARGRMESTIVVRRTPNAMYQSSVHLSHVLVHHSISSKTHIFTWEYCHVMSTGNKCCVYYSTTRRICPERRRQQLALAIQTVIETNTKALAPKHSRPQSGGIHLVILNIISVSKLCIKLTLFLNLTSVNYG